METPPLSPRLASIDRSQLLLHSIDVEKLIDEDHSGRAIWELIGRLDLSRYHAEIAAVEGHAGRDQPVVEPVEYTVFIGGSSTTTNAADFTTTP